MNIEQYIQKTYSANTKDTIAYCILLSSNFFWVTGFIYSNQNHLSPVQTSLSRYSVAAIVSYFIAISMNSKWNVSNKSSFLKLLIRSFILVIHSFVVSKIQFYLSLNIYHILGCTAPIFTFISNYLFNGIKATKAQMIGIALTFVGLVFVINSELMYSWIMNEGGEYQFQTNFENYQTTDIYVQILVAVLYLVWTFIWSISILFTKIQEYNFAQMLFVVGVMGVPFFGIWYSTQSQQQTITHVPVQIYGPSLLWVGVPITCANLLFNMGLKLASNIGKATSVVVTNVIIAYFISIFRYGEKVNFFALIGTVVIIGSVFIILLSKSQAPIQPIVKQQAQLIEENQNNFLKEKKQKA